MEGTSRCRQAFPESEMEVEFYMSKPRGLPYTRAGLFSLDCRCSPELREKVGPTREPYREIIKKMEHDLKETMELIQVQVAEFYCCGFLGWGCVCFWVERNGLCLCCLAN